MAFAGELGLRLDLTMLPSATPIDVIAQCFAETPSRYLLEVDRRELDAIDAILQKAGVPYGVIGEFDDTRRLRLRDECDISIDDLHAAWAHALNW
jgi:phosphoribosylformylglycinamidine synthase subunit PurSL